ncbi:MULTISPECIES: chaplin [Streptomyces]|uniref:Chaplin n=1 Tax=Streptomyces solicathayae TaxID=3081768 RepID=A0ABZ0LUH1_9ACTN|nr:chaplin [Streptomyces sp. HUAS YS2]WOX22408.1 chaplin [Streptomyces sp. HUAS YS2]
MLGKKAATVVAGLVIAMGAASPAFADSEAVGFAAGSPGILSGNNVQVPINIPINVCGNSINIVALLNPAVGNVCINR